MKPRRGDMILFHTKARGLQWRGLSAPPLVINWLLKVGQGHEVTHAALLLSPTYNALLEASGPGVEKDYLDSRKYRTFYEWGVYRPKGVTLKQQAEAVALALNWVGRPYDRRVFWTVGKYVLGERVGVYPLSRRREKIVDDNDRKFFCDEAVLTCYDQTGYDFAGKIGFKDTSAVVPADIMRNIDCFDKVASSPGWRY